MYMVGMKKYVFGYFVLESDKKNQDQTRDSIILKTV